MAENKSLNIKIIFKIYLKMLKWVKNISTSQRLLIKY